MPEHADIPTAETFGQRVQRARERTGKTRAVVAGLMGQSTEWVKAVETGRIGIPRPPKLLRLAHVLGVEDLAELTGDERISATTYSKGQHGDLPVIKRALTTYQRPVGERQPEPGDVLTARVRQAWKLWPARDRRTGPKDSVEGNRSASALSCPHCSRTPGTPPRPSTEPIADGLWSRSPRRTTWPSSS